MGISISPVLLRSVAIKLAIASSLGSTLGLVLPMWAQAQDSVSAEATIVPDASLAEERSRLQEGPTQQETLIEGGAQRGANLFHSFERFGVSEGETVRFVVPLSDSMFGAVDRVFARVKGGQATQILGTLGTTAAADLFLINPSGIFFGPNARLDVRGSFAASTAESIVFADGLTFAANESQAPPLLTVSVPVGLQLGSNPDPIQVIGEGNASLPFLPRERETGNLSFFPSSSVLGPLPRPTEVPMALQVPEGNTLAFIGGEITLDGGLVVSESGRVVLGAVGAGEQVNLTPHIQGWEFDFSGISQFADLELDGRSFVDASGTTAGFIQLIGENISVSGGSIALIQQNDFQDTLSAVGGIEVTATDLLRIDGSTIGIERVANNTAVDESVAEGSTGTISVSARNLSQFNGGAIGTLNFSRRDGASIEVMVNGEVDLQGNSSPPDPNNRFSPFLRRASSIVTATLGDGDAGDVRVTAENIRINPGIIGSNTLPLLSELDGSVQGDAGNVTALATDTIVIDGIVPNTPSGISLILSSTATAGNGGTLQVETGDLILRNGGSIDTASAGTGTGGDATIIANRSIEITGNGLLSNGLDNNVTTHNSSIQAGVSSEDIIVAVGVGLPIPLAEPGRLTISTPSLTLNEGTRLSTGNSGPNMGGPLNIFADEIFIGANAQIVAETFNDLGGTITIQPLSSTLEETQLVLDGFDASISTQAVSVPALEGTVGNAGSITIDTGRVVIRNGASLSVSSPVGEAGTLTINAENLELDRGSLIAVAGANGSDDTPVGNIELNVSENLLLRNESRISAEAFGTADGGNVTIDTQSIIAFPATGTEGSDIIARANDGQGGNINITAQGVFGLGRGLAEPANERNDIDPSSAFGLDGMVVINSPEVDPSQSLVTLPTTILGVENLIAQGCNPTGLASSGYFAVVGRGGLSNNPAEPLSSNNILADIRLPNHWGQTAATPSKNLITQPASPMVETQGWVTDRQGNVVLVSEKPSPSLKVGCRIEQTKSGAVVAK